MQAIIRKDEQAVSPVIATILMVAITVVLAAVLYVMVSGLITGPGQARTMGVSIVRSGDGTNWVLTVVNAPTGLTAAATKISVIKSNGATNLTATPFSQLDVAGEGAQFFDGGIVGTVDATDRILLSTSWYASSTRAEISDASGILFSGILQ